MEAKWKLAVRFVMSKLKEYNKIRQRLAERLVGIEKMDRNLLPLLNLRL